MLVHGHLGAALENLRYGQEPFLISILGLLILKSSRIETTQRQQPQMIRSFAALVIFALLGASVIALPGFAPNVEAREAAVLVKGDRLQIREAAVNCSKAVWPDLPASCLQTAGARGKILEARLVTARR
jgi:hypothetical protein